MNKSVDSRVQISKSEDVLEILIKAFCDEKKQSLLLLWVVLFSLCGLIIVSQFFFDYPSSTKVFFGAYVAFWLFFEFKVIYAYRWRKYGQEKIIIEKDIIYIIKTIGKRGITQRINTSDIKSIDLFKDVNGNFAKAMNTSYWNINKYNIAIHIENESIPFAIDLTQKEAKKIITEMRKHIEQVNA